MSSINKIDFGGTWLTTPARALSSQLQICQHGHFGESRVMALIGHTCDLPTRKNKFPIQARLPRNFIRKLEAFSLEEEYRYQSIYC